MTNDDFDFPPFAHPWREAFTAILFSVLIVLGICVCALMVIMGPK